MNIYRKIMPTWIHQIQTFTQVHKTALTICASHVFAHHQNCLLENIMFRLLKALPVTLALAALSISATGCGSSSSAQARFVNAIPNTAVYGGSLDVEVNTTKEFSNVVFPNASASTYASVPSGNDTILGLQTGTTTQVFSDTTTLSSGKQYTLVANGSAGGTVVLLSIPDTNTAPASGNVEFRVINASPSGPLAVDVYIEPTPFNGNLTNPAISALAQTQASSYVTLPWNSDGSGWTIIVTAAGSTTPYNGFNFNTGNIGGQSTTAIRTLVLTDVQNGNSMSLNPIVLSDLN
jgi:hypothetical protein